jgi:ABC-2 type transport system permease protein
MAVYKRGYQRYTGPRTDRWTRFLAIPRHAWARLFDQKLVLIALMASLFWPLGCGVYIYIANHAELWAGLGGDFAKNLQINGTFFLVFMNTQATMAVILAAIAGPGLVAPDLANNALPLYFSRPQSRSDYALARLTTLAGLLALVTVIPGLFLFFLQSGLKGWDWMMEQWALGAGVLAGFTLWILLVSLVALACSAWVKWRIIAGALTFAFFVVLAGAGGIINQIFDDNWGSLLNPVLVMNRLWSDMFGVENEDLPGRWASLTALFAFGALLIATLERKLRPVEVIK